MQNLVQTSTLVQNSLCQDLDRLRTVNLYEGCIQETRTCLLLSLSNDWIASNTGFLLIHQSWSKHINIGTHKLCMTVQLITISIPYRTQSTSHPAYCVICPVPTTLWQPRTTRMETLFAANVKLLLLLVLVTTHSLPAMPSAHWLWVCIMYCKLGIYADDIVMYNNEDFLLIQRDILYLYATGLKKMDWLLTRLNAVMWFSRRKGMFYKQLFHSMIITTEYLLDKISINTLVSTFQQIYLGHCT